MKHKKFSRFDIEYSNFYFTERDLDGKFVDSFTKKFVNKFADNVKSLNTPCHIHASYSINIVDSYQKDENGIRPIVHIVNRPIDFYIADNENELNKILEKNKDKQIKVVNKKLHPIYPYQFDGIDLSIWLFLNRVENTKQNNINVR